jgi:DNA-binding response OmpR family regulator
MGKGKILIVEDDSDIVEMIEYNLKAEGYETLSAFDGKKGVELAQKEHPDLLILDIMLPVTDGFEVCRILKRKDTTADIPIIILSAKSQETDKVVGLELGADDYITKPFSPRELLARTKAILRRATGPKISNRIEVKNIVIDVGRYKVTVRGKEIPLTLTEFKLLEFMARHCGEVLSRNQILDGAFGHDSMVIDRTVDAHIKSLRQKLDKAKDCIETIRGVGYRFREK